jgi:hypothetical protein
MLEQLPHAGALAVVGPRLAGYPWGMATARRGTKATSRKHKRTTHTPEVEERLEHIAGLMRAGTFERGRTARELAVVWGLCRQRVRELTAEASHRVMAEGCSKARR